MRCAATALTAFTGQALAHPGTQMHFHALGIEHVLLFVVVLGLLAFAAKK